MTLRSFVSDLEKKVLSNFLTTDFNHPKKFRSENYTKVENVGRTWTIPSFKRINPSLSYLPPERRLTVNCTSRYINKDESAWVRKVIDSVIGHDDRTSPVTKTLADRKWGEVEPLKREDETRVGITPTVDPMWRKGIEWSTVSLVRLRENPYT